LSPVHSQPTGYVAAHENHGAPARPRVTGFAANKLGVIHSCANAPTATIIGDLQHFGQFLSRYRLLLVTTPAGSIDVPETRRVKQLNAVKEFRELLSHFILRGKEQPLHESTEEDNQRAPHNE
jgi:hypothetical protein